MSGIALQLGSAVMAGCVLLAACGCERSGSAQSSGEEKRSARAGCEALVATTKPAAKQAQIADDWLPPYRPAGRPPRPTGPALDPQCVPTKYADAYIAMRIVMRQTSPQGDQSVQATEVCNVDKDMVHARQTVETKFGKFTSKIAFNRYHRPDYIYNHKPTPRKHVGIERIKVAGKVLVCDVYEVRQHGRAYRTWICRDIFGHIVKHAEKAAGKWQVRLELIDFAD